MSVVAVSGVASAQEEKTGAVTVTVTAERSSLMGRLVRSGMMVLIREWGA